MAQRCRLRSGWRIVAGFGMLLGGLLGRPALVSGQETLVVDSLAIEGNRRVSADQIFRTSGIVLFQPTNFRNLQRAIQALFRTGQFDDVRIERRSEQPLVLALVVLERPILSRWAVRGTDKLEERQVRGKVGLVEGRPLDRAAAERSRSAIDSLYKSRGFYAATVKLVEAATGPGAARLLFDITEGNRVAIAQVQVEGNQTFKDELVVSGMTSKPEGFWWFQKGEFSEEKLDLDVRQNLPKWYGDRGHIDFQVLDDTLLTDGVPGKAILRLEVEEGEQYRVGTFNVVGNRRYSTDEVTSFLPFGSGVEAGSGKEIDVPFSASEWADATDKLQTLYANNGYIYSRVVPEAIRRTGPTGKSYLDLRWSIQEGSPASINRIIIVGNDVTHERVIREQIVMLPGQTFSRDALIRSYENVSNLNFFQQPMPPPDVQPTENGVDVDIVFRVVEKRTGNVQFGATLGQGTGVGGFIGLEEPNLFGKAKRGKLQWQFGRNINDFNLSYTDPAFRESRISTTLTLFNSRQRYTVGDLGRQKRVGGTLQVGLPLLGARYTRLFTSYGYQLISYSEGSEDFRATFACDNCARSSVGATVVRDTRIGLPFPVAGQSLTVSGELNGGVLGGTGDYQKIDVDGRWYTPIAVLGGSGQWGAECSSCWD